MKINDFSGGLSTRLDPTLIQPNEAVLFNNIDNTANTLQAAKKHTLTSTSIEKWFNFFNGIWYSGFDDRDYVKHNNKLYFTSGANFPRKIVAGVDKQLGIVKPADKLIPVDGGAGSISTSAETLQYTYTYYDSSEGIESEPAEYSDELSLGANKQVDITGFSTPSNPSVDLIRLYRVGAGATQFTLLVELPISTINYTDNISTVDALGYLLDTIGAQAPQPGLTNLTKAYGMLFGSIGTKVYYSEIGKPDVFPYLNVIDLYDNVTGILPIQDGILLFTDTETHLLVGDKPSKFVKLEISTEYGCNSHKSCKVVKQVPIWSSTNGLCTYTNGAINTITQDKLGQQTFDVINAVIHNEHYILCLADGSLFSMDMRFKKSFKTFDFVEIENIGIFEGSLYAVVGGYVATLFTGDLASIDYTSPDFTEGDATVLKQYNNIYIRSNGYFRLTILIDGEEVSYETLEGNKIFDIKVPQEKQRGSSIQFNIKGHGVLKEIEYKVMGRQNGR